MKQDEFILKRLTEIAEFEGLYPEGVPNQKALDIINHLLSKQPSGDIEKIKKIKPDYNHSESYQHGFHDAIQVVLDTMNSPKSKQKPSEVNWQWVEDEHFKWYKSKTMVTPQAHLLFLKNLLKYKSLPQPLSEVSEANLKRILVDFLDGIRDYEHENNGRIYEDERESIEFVDIYLESGDYNHLKKVLSLSLPTDSKEKEAVGFAEWVYKNYISNGIGKYYHNNWNGDLDTLVNYTTQELFTLYKEGGTK